MLPWFLVTDTIRKDDFSFDFEIKVQIQKRYDPIINNKVYSDPEAQLKSHLLQSVWQIVVALEIDR